MLQQVYRGTVNRRQCFSCVNQFQNGMYVIAKDLAVQQLQELTEMWKK
jgi:hypothetical protein